MINRYQLCCDVSVYNTQCFPFKCKNTLTTSLFHKLCDAARYFHWTFFFGGCVAKFFFRTFRRKKSRKNLAEQRKSFGTTVLHTHLLEYPQYLWYVITKKCNCFSYVINNIVFIFTIIASQISLFSESQQYEIGKKTHTSKIDNINFE